MYSTISFTVLGGQPGAHGGARLNAQNRAAPPVRADTACAQSGVEILVARLDADADTVRELAALLSGGERQRAGKFVFGRDRRRYTVARGRLRQLLGERLGASAAAIEIEHGARGKPTLAGRYAASGLRFNVAHSGAVAAYAFARGREVGIDVETVCALPDADDIAARFFSRRECEAYRALAPALKPAGFFNCWTRKEAFIKALGAGLAYPLDRFDVTLAPGEPAEILRVEDTPGKDCGWTLHAFAPGPGLAGAFVVRNPR